MGVFCIMYYVSICLYLRRWNTVFPRLWLVLGTMLCLFGWKKNLLDKGLLAGIYAFCAVFLAFFIVVELLILSGMRKSLKEQECGYIIVLGAKVDG